MTRPSELKWVEHSSSTRDAHWFDDYHDNMTLGSLVEQAVVRSLHSKFEDYPPDITLPFMWRDSDGNGGPCPDDPLTLYVHLPIMLDSDDRVIFSCSLEGVIDDMIEDFVTPETGKVVDDEHRDTCVKMALRLRELAAKLDAACKE